MKTSTDYLELPRKANRHVNHIPGDNGALPILGDTVEFLKDYHGLINRKYKLYGPIYRNNALLQRNIALLGPEANELVLKDSDKIFSSKKAWDPLLDKLFPNGLMLRDFDVHRFHRKVLQAAFKKESLQAYLETMNPRMRQGVIDFPKDNEFGFKDSIKSLLLNVAAQVFMGVEMGKEADKINKGFLHAMEASMAVVKLPIPGTTWYKGIKGRQALEEFIQKHITAKRATESGDFFSQFCHAKDEDGNELSDEAVRDHIIFLLFAAHDTTTSTLCSIIYAIAKNPEWQDILHSEYQQITRDDLQYDDLPKLEKTGLVMKEALRMYPPVPVIPRRTIKETEIMGYRIPANTGIGVSPLFTHYMAEWWTEPQKFDPERFSAERAEHKRHFYQWIPFGGGHHKCIGLNFAEMQVKLFLFHLLRNHTISVKPGYKMQFNVVPIVFPTDGLPIQINKRKA
ncbi:cytochrome P450 [Zhongshania sp.]|uniref:cytochrome P450 n=1 Tax=Zhongshania sp. TaxID=1971902 RepID=UPI0035633E94